MTTNRHLWSVTSGGLEEMVATYIGVEQWVLIVEGTIMYYTLKRMELFNTGKSYNSK